MWPLHILMYMKCCCPFRTQEQIFLQNFENIFACQGIVSHSTLSHHEAVCVSGHQPICHFDPQSVLPAAKYRKQWNVRYFPKIIYHMQDTLCKIFVITSVTVLFTGFVGLIKLPAWISQRACQSSDGASALLSCCMYDKH